MSMQKDCDYCGGVMTEKDQDTEELVKALEKNGVKVGLSLEVEDTPDLHLKCKRELFRTLTRTTLDGMVLRRRKITKPAPVQEIGKKKEAKSG